MWQGCVAVEHSADMWFDPGDVEDLVGCVLRGGSPGALDRMGALVFLDDKGQEVTL